MEFDFDHALCVYLGGDSNSGGIQIGMGDERLSREFNSDAPAIKGQLDQFLEEVIEFENTNPMPAGHTLRSWLANEFPNLSNVCRNKIASHVLYQQH